MPADKVNLQRKFLLIWDTLLESRRIHRNVLIRFIIYDTDSIAAANPDYLDDR